MEPSRIKENEFFDQLILAKILEGSQIKNQEHFLFILNTINHNRAGVLGELREELNNNLLLITENAAQKKYLKRLNIRINEVEILLNDKVETIGSQPLFKWDNNYPKNRLIVEIPNWRIVNLYKHGFYYLNVLKAIINLYDSVENSFVTHRVQLIVKMYNVEFNNYDPKILSSSALRKVAEIHYKTYLELKTNPSGKKIVREAKLHELEAAAPLLIGKAKEQIFKKINELKKT